MQLYSVEQKRSQALEAHAAAFSTLSQGGTQSTVISFAQKTYNNGVLTSKLHVIELGAAAGKDLMNHNACTSCRLSSVQSPICMSIC